MSSAKMSLHSNAAAWITGPKITPLQVKDAPYPDPPGPNELIVETAFVAINPLEYKIQDIDPPLAGKQIQYPTILGADLAGTVVTVGNAVSAFKVGDRIIANAVGLALGKPHMSAFQKVVLLHESCVTPVPDHIALEAASVLPLACDTAMAGLFVGEALALSTHYLGDREAQPPAPGSVVLVWGGSSSVGCCAIQMAHAAGYEVYTTASNHNRDLCISIGADKVFDRSSESVELDIIDAMRGKTTIGAIDCIADGETTIPSCARILAETDGLRKVMCVLSPTKTNFAGSVQAQRLSIPALRQSKQYAIVHSWMAKALANGSLQPKPDAKIIGDGLESIQSGIDIVRNGVSASKIVVRFPR